MTHDNQAKSQSDIFRVLSQSPVLMNMIETVKTPLVLFALILIAVAISTFVEISLAYSDPAAVSENYATASRLAIGMAILSDSLAIQFPGNIALVAVCFLVLLLFVSLDKKYTRSASMTILAISFSCFSVVGRYYSVSEAGMDVYQFVKVAFCFIGFFCLLYPTLVIIRYFLIKRPAFDFPSSKVKFINKIFEAKPFLIPFIVILICWLPYIVLCFPGTTDPNDVLDQLQQYRGIYSVTAQYAIFDENSWLYLNNHHPFFSTLLINLFFDFGTFIGSQNIGMFLLVAIQTILLASAFALTFVLMKRFSTPIVIRLVALSTYAIAPVFPGYAICITKDTLFSIFVVYYVILLIILVSNANAFRENKLLFVAFFASALLMSLMRNNGVYMLLLSAPLLFFIKGKAYKVAGAVGCSVLVAYFAYSSVLLPALGVADGSVKEMLSVPFQQTARYVANYPDEVTDLERETIDRILDYDTLSDRYNPTLSDDVKATFNKNASKQDLMEYFAVWAEMGMKHPGTYVSATMANCYAYFYPGVSTGWIWTQLNRFGQFDAQDVRLAYLESGIDISQNESWRPYQIALSKWYEITSRSPLGLTTNMALCAWAILFASVMLMSMKKMKEVIPFMPLLALLFVCILSPQNGNPRYALPLICATPVLLAFFLGQRRFRAGLNSETV